MYLDVLVLYQPPITVFLPLRGDSYRHTKEYERTLLWGGFHSHISIQARILTITSYLAN